MGGTMSQEELKRNLENREPQVAQELERLRTTHRALAQTLAEYFGKIKES